MQLHARAAPRGAGRAVLQLVLLSLSLPEKFAAKPLHEIGRSRDRTCPYRYMLHARAVLVRGTIGGSDARRGARALRRSQW